MKRQLRSLNAETMSSRLLAGLKSVSAMAILSLLLVSWSTNSRAQVDCNPEIIVDCPAPATVSCVDFQSMIATPPAYAVTCNVEGTVEVTSSDNTISSNACGYTLVRTWTYSIGSLSTTCSQVYNVIDNVGPSITGLGGDRAIECDQPMPGASQFVATDACGQVVQTEVLVSSSQSNSDATAGRQIRCQLTTPFGPGPDGSIWLNNAQQLGLASSNYWSWTGAPQLVSYDDGTAHLTGDVVNNANAAQGWHVDMWFKNRRDWAAWSALGRSYKDDLGFGSANHLNWDYYELADVFSTLTGYGAYTGNVLYMSHQPTNYYFGFQAGVGANNRNGNEGMSGWFYWNGWFNGQWRTGNGDMFTDKYCIPENNACEYTKTYVYRAKDACGNNSFASETITVRDTQAPVFQNCPESMTIQCGTEVPAAIAAENIVAIDACHNATVSYLGETVENPDACTTVISRRYVATDDCGNSARCTQTITVVDTLAPVLSVPANIDAQCYEQVVFADASATDCHGFEISEVRDTVAGQCPQSYTIIRHFTATDICGNSSEGTQEIHVTDSEAPVFDQLDTYVQVECTEVDNVPAPTATDRCGAVTVQLVEETLNSGGCLGVLQRTTLHTTNVVTRAKKLMYSSPFWTQLLQLSMHQKVALSSVIKFQITQRFL